MAATNAHFWLNSSWRSGEEMMIRSHRFSVRLPPHPYVDLLSVSAVQTLIITLQGMQAIYEIIGSQFNAFSQYSQLLNLGSVFFPLAILGLLRLPAALWICQDSAYAYPDIQLRAMGIDLIPLTEPETQTIPFLLDSHHDKPQFRPQNGFHGITVRTSYILFLLFFTGFTIHATIPQRFTHIALAGYVQVIVFLSLSFVTSTLLIFYSLRGQSTTTIILCISSIWYKVYTAFLFLSMLLLVILAAIETRQTWCGLWTMFPPGLGPCPLSIKIGTGTIEIGYGGFKCISGNGTTLIG